MLPSDHVEPSESFDFVGMLLLSPGLAAFLFGVSSIPEAGTITGHHGAELVGVGIVLIVAFVPWALRPANIHPLVDLRLLKNKNMTVAVIAMMLFAIAFFGASLLFPLYFQEVRGETALKAGLLLAPQGIGAMVTMPIAGVLADRIGPGKIVMTGIAVITVGMGMFTQIEADTGYAYLIGALFIMGLGMGGTMMPIMSAALATLSEPQHRPRLDVPEHHPAGRRVHRYGAVLGAADQRPQGQRQPRACSARSVRSRTSRRSSATLLAEAGLTPAELPLLQARALADMADAFSFVFVVATILVACCLIPAAFLPRSKPAQPVDPTRAGGSLTLSRGSRASEDRASRDRLVRLDGLNRRCCDWLSPAGVSAQVSVPRVRGRTAAGAGLAEGPGGEGEGPAGGDQVVDEQDRAAVEGLSRSRSKRRVTAATRWAELAAPWPGRDGRVDDAPARRRGAA